MFSLKKRKIIEKKSYIIRNTYYTRIIASTAEQKKIASLQAFSSMNSNTFMYIYNILLQDLNDPNERKRTEVENKN